jgi:1,2-beta-oligoglucan phosphorylase
MALRLRVLDGPALRLRLTLHLALGGDDGTTPLQAPMRHEPDGSVFIAVPPGSELAARFPDGGLRIEPESGSTLEQVHDDSALYADKRSRGLPFVCIDSGAVSQFGLRLMGRLVDAASPPPGEAPLPAWTLPTAGADAAAAQRLADILPWYRHNALVHYLSPRGLEQYSGGGWGTRDVCQGPLEMLLALGRTAPVRDLLCRVFAAQNADGDWPQWFMFFERERTSAPAIRTATSSSGRCWAWRATSWPAATPRCSTSRCPSTPRRATPEVAAAVAARRSARWR